MTNVGPGYIITAPGLASASVTIWMRSSEPLPSRTSMPGGTPILRAISARSLGAARIRIAVEVDAREDFGAPVARA